MQSTNKRDWSMAIAIARLAPNTGMVTMKAQTLLAGNAELERLRGHCDQMRDARETLAKPPNVLAQAGPKDAQRP